MISDGCQTILALPAKRERNIYMFYLKISGVSGISRTSPFNKRVIQSEIWNQYVNLLVELCLREGFLYDKSCLIFKLFYCFTLGRNFHVPSMA